MIEVLRITPELRDKLDKVADGVDKTNQQQTLARILREVLDAIETEARHERDRV